MKQFEYDNESKPKQPSANRFVSFILHVLVPLIILACGIALAVYLLKTSPEAKPRKRPASATLVEVEKLQIGPRPTMISSMGEVIAARKIDLKPQVAGEVTALSDEFIPGGYFMAGESILKIDTTDYELVIRQLESETKKAESDLALEMGNQRIALREYEILGEQVSGEEETLILRKPQLTKLQASLAVARTKLAKAQLDLKRTELAAPFNAVIQSRSVDRGARVTGSTVLATLVGTDTFWIQLTLPVEQLRWIRIPDNSGEQGSSVKIFPQGSGDRTQYRLGRVIRLAAALEKQGRMAQLLVSIDDPLCRRLENRAKPRLLLGSYVKAEIEGIGIESAITINRAHLREGSTVWLMSDEGALEILEVEVLFRARDHVVLAGGVKGGDHLVTSRLASPIEGTPLRLQPDGAPTPSTKNGRRATQERGKGKTNGIGENDQ